MGETASVSNGMVNQVLHANNVRSTQGLAGNQMARPLSITVQDASNGATLWGTGNYVYDGAGNITRAGGNYYLYDHFGRVTEGTAEYVSGSNHKLQRHTYDAFGNMTSMNTVVNGATTVARTIGVSSSTNRLTTSPFAAAYDSAGNLKLYGSQETLFDSQSMLRTTSGVPGAAGSPQIDYYYTADDERIWQHNRSANTSRWTVRGLDQKVLREYTTTGSPTAQTWTFFKDYVYRGSAAIAAVTPSGTTHFGLDHLGSTRVTTNASRAIVHRTDYYPFGEEATALNPETKQYTGHERDYLGGTGTQNANYLDYMHARFYTPIVGRFLSPDPVLNVNRHLQKPQGWNRYAYVENNPINATDPTGREIYLQVHQVVPYIGYHTSIRIEPVDQTRYAHDADFQGGGSNPATGRRFMTLGAGPEDHVLVSRPNRDRDLDLSIKSSVTKIDLKGRDENQVISQLRAADSKYKDNLPYALIPVKAASVQMFGRSVPLLTATYNSNSFVGGLLRAVGLIPPKVKEPVPGFDLPIPIR
jgi:RHS repeat-associated protein